MYGEVLKPLARIISLTRLQHGENSVDSKEERSHRRRWNELAHIPGLRDYDAGIVGKAEFMAHQSLYTKAINNTDGVATESAITDVGWATDGTYKTKLVINI